MFEDGDKTAPAKGRVESALSKEIRTAQQQFSSTLDLQNGQSTHFSLESNLKLLYWRSRGTLSPRRELIIDLKQILRRHRL